MKKQQGSRIWYGVQHSLCGRPWQDDMYPTFDTEEEAIAGVRRMNAPDERIITTVLKD